MSQGEVWGDSCSVGSAGLLCVSGLPTAVFAHVLKTALCLLLFCF